MGGDDEKTIDGEVNTAETVDAGEIKPVLTDPVLMHLQAELERCQMALRQVGDSQLQMVAGARTFTGLWTAVIHNAVRLYGRAAVRAALTKIGRPEDAVKMY